MKYEELKAKVCAGIVLYNPDIAVLKKNIDALYQQVDTIILIDNASENIDEVYSLVDKYRNIIVQKNAENYGIAKALNQLLDFAYKKGYEWFLTMDQDSRCSNNLIFEYAKYMPEDSRVAVLCPFVLNNNKITFEEYKKLNLCTVENVLDPIDCITSGSLNRTSSALKIRGYYDKLFIDCVDVDFNIRLFKDNFKIIRVNSAFMFQSMGDAKKVILFDLIYRVTGSKLLKKLRYTPVYSDLRLYYIARNSSIIWQKYGAKAGKRMTPSWMKKQFVYYLLTYPITRNRIAMIKSINKGLQDGREFV